MQGDLISRSALIETIEQDIKMTERFMEKLANLYKVNSKEYACLNAQLNTLKSFKGIVEQKTTAYDVEKVLAQMDKKNSTAIECLGEQNGQGFIRVMKLAKQIVRNGGKE